MDPTPVAALTPTDPRIDRVAGGLHELGVRSGDRVAWQLPNSRRAVDLLWACWRLGATAVPVHHRATDAERDVMLGPLDVAFELDPDQAHSLDGPAISAGHSARDGRALTDPLAPALILHTSGSSGPPKGVMHTQASLGSKAARMAAIHGLGADDVVLMPAPLAHISGVLNGVTLPAAAGMHTVLMDRWDPQRALALIASEHVTFMVGPPTFFHDLLETAGRGAREALGSLRLISLGGTGVTSDFCEDLALATGGRVKRSYGSTEAPTLTTTIGGDPEPWARCTDGRAFRPTELRIAANGEIQARGPELFAGYTDSALTAQVCVDGWFRTGDLGELDEHDCLTVLGRLADLIIRGGENVSPTVVESTLASHPDIVDVCVVGIADDRLGERVGAAVVLAPGAAVTVADLANWCSRAGLSRFAWPERILATDAIPRLASGKADRRALAASSSDSWAT